LSEAPIETELAVLRAENAELKAALAQVTQQLEWFKRQLFGRKSERHLPPDPSQGNLLADLAPEPPAGAVPTETVTYTRRASKNRGNAVHESGLRFDATVPVQVIQQPAPELQGPEAEAFAVIGEKITHRLAQRPGSYVILEYRRPVLKRRETEQVITTPASPNVLERSVADVSFLVGLLVDKFLYHVRHEVARSFIKDLDLMFSHQSPIGPCVGGNPGVRSVRDNVAAVFGRVTTPRGSVTTASSKAVGSQGCGAWSTQVNRHVEPPLRTTCQRS
jgi:hypothetical protein